MGGNGSKLEHNLDLQHTVVSGEEFYVATESVVHWITLKMVLKWSLMLYFNALLRLTEKV